MTSLCLYFQVHQPHRIGQYRVIDVGRRHDYFDADLNRDLVRKVASNCYEPANRLLLDALARHPELRVTFSISGVAWEQIAAYAPAAAQSFRQLAASPQVELLAETYHHSLASQFEADEFIEQVSLHRQLMRDELGQTPQVLRNTELVYDDRVGHIASELGFSAVLAEGADDVLGTARSANSIYRVAGRQTRLLLRDYRISDDVAFRFHSSGPGGRRLTAADLLRSAASRGGGQRVVNLFVDYETFGEHHWADSGIFELLAGLPAEAAALGSVEFCTPSEAIARHPAEHELSFGRTTSWADTERDLSAWTGNSMQQRALAQCYRLGSLLALHPDRELTHAWRRLQTSDHFYYMSTKQRADGEVHAYFSPFESPYEAFMNYMNALSDLELRISGQVASAPARVSDYARAS